MPLYAPSSSTIILARSAVALSYTGGTTETVLATVKIPGGAMGPDGILRVTTLWSFPNNANTKTLRARFGGTIVQSIAMTANVNLRDQRQIQNRGVVNSQVFANNGMTGGWAANTGGLGTATIDTSVDQDYTFAALLGVGTDTIQLESYLIELIP